MKVLFINPPYKYPVSEYRGIKRFGRIWPPLDLVNMVSMLEERGIKADILDLHALPFKSKFVENFVKKYDKIFITFSQLDRWQCPLLDVNGFLNFSKQISALKETYLMGFHPSVFLEKFLRESKAKGIVIGEPETIVYDFLVKGKKEGIYFGKNSKIEKNRKYLDLNELPRLRYEKLPMKRYKYELMGDKFFLVEASRGCPYGCLFCAKKIMYGEGYRIKSSEKVLEEIDELYQKHNVRNIYFIDLEFTVPILSNIKNVEKILDGLISRKYDLKLACQTRVDTVNYEMLKKMKKAGFDLIHFGIESGSERIMKINGKGINRKQVVDTVKKCNKLGIRSVGFFMFGFYGETLKDMLKTVEFAKKSGLTYASFHIATPYPGSYFYEIIKEKFDLKEEMPYYNLEMDEEILKKMISFAYKKFYLTPKTVKSFFSSSDIFGQVSLFLNFSKD